MQREREKVQTVISKMLGVFLLMSLFSFKSIHRTDANRFPLPLQFPGIIGLDNSPNGSDYKTYSQIGKLGGGGGGGGKL